MLSKIETRMPGAFSENDHVGRILPWSNFRHTGMLPGHSLSRCALYVGIGPAIHEPVSGRAYFLLDPDDSEA